MNLKKLTDLPDNIESYINTYDEGLNDSDFNDLRYSYRVIYVPKLVNHKGQADKVIEFLPHDSEVAKNINKEYVYIKEKEKNKFLPKQIVELMQKKGFIKFTMHKHTQLWKEKNAKGIKNKFGVQVHTQWYWYESWLKEVESHCVLNKDIYT